MLVLVRRWWPKRDLVLVVDGALAAVKLGLHCAADHADITFVSRLRLALPQGKKRLNLVPQPWRWALLTISDQSATSCSRPCSYREVRHNLTALSLIHWTKQPHVAQTDFAPVTTRPLVQHGAPVRVRWSWTATFNLFSAPSNRCAARLLEPLQTRPLQLELPFARLHKT